MNWSCNESRSRAFADCDGSRKKLRILVIHPNGDDAESLLRLLGKQGHEVHVAANADGAVPSGEISWPDVVFMNWQPATLSAVHSFTFGRDGKRPLVIALAKSTTPTNRLPAADGFVDLYLSEPFDSCQLLGFLRRFQAILQ